MDGWMVGQMGGRAVFSVVQKCQCDVGIYEIPQALLNVSSSFYYEDFL